MTVDTLMELYGVMVPPTSSTIASVTSAHMDVEPMADGHRTTTSEAAFSSSQMPVEAEHPGLASGEEGSEEAAEAAAAPLDFNIAYQFAVRMFANGKDASISRGGDAVLEATVGDCGTVKEVIKVLYRNRLDDICRSPERPDLRLSQEEAQGHLLATSWGTL